eukprot:270094-Prymnesium_polylepis.1
MSPVARSSTTRPCVASGPTRACSWRRRRSAPPLEPTVRPATAASLPRQTGSRRLTERWHWRAGPPEVAMPKSRARSPWDCCPIWRPLCARPSEERSSPVCRSQEPWRTHCSLRAAAKSGPEQSERRISRRLSTCWPYAWSEVQHGSPAHCGRRLGAATAPAAGSAS